MNKPQHYGGGFDPEGIAAKLAELEAALTAPGAWDNPEKLTPVLRDKSALETEAQRLRTLDACCREVRDWLELAEGDQDPEVLLSLEQQIDALQGLLDEAEVSVLLEGEENKQAAIVEVHPGAGGTESQDWAEMLVRMYMRWADEHGSPAEYLDYQAGDGAGIKNVTLRIAAPNAYGLLRGEKGIHRLIRISPFDASGRRHTSFASVDVIPDVGQDIKIDINDADLRIDVFRASGPGGQKVNKTSSAVRITHIPTGLVAQCQNEKSQHQNKDMAMRILRARLYERELKRVEDEKQAQYADKDSISWGSQIRTYTLQPYRLVKDHRTNTEVGDVDKVLDGNLGPFIKSYLLYRHEHKKQ